MSIALEHVRKRLSAVGTKERARQEKAYLKSDLVFLGATVPATTKITKQFAREHSLTRTEVLRLAREAWRTDVHELRSFGVGLLELHLPLLEKEDFPLVEQLIAKANTWAHVDELAADIAGGMVIRFPTLKRTLRRWARDENFWVRRAALLSLLQSLKQSGDDWKLFTELASLLLEEKEFFIRKAIGWVLREVSKKRPEPVFEFLKENLDRVSGLTLREGSKYLPDKMKRRLQR